MVSVITLQRLSYYSRDRFYGGLTTLERIAAPRRPVASASRESRRRDLIRGIYLRRIRRRILQHREVEK